MASKKLKYVYSIYFNNDFTYKEICAIIKKPTITETIRLHRLCWFGHEQRREGNRIPTRVLYMSLETTRPRNRWKNEVREYGRIVGVEK
jgi:hypothetical protein